MEKSTVNGARRSALPDRLLRWSTVAAVTAVAGVAGWVSYEHALAVVRAHGESGAVAQLYPLTVDGLIYSASMVLLDAARRGVRAPSLARWLLGCGIAATLAANVTAGLHFGAVGAIVAAWPAAALVGSYELLMMIIRHGAARPVPGTEPAPLPQPAEAPVSIQETVTAVAPAQSFPAAPGHASEHADEAHPEEVIEDVPEAHPEPEPEHTPESTPKPSSKPRAPRARKSTAKKSKTIDPAKHYAGMLDAGELPSARAIARDMHVGQSRAATIRRELSASLRPLHLVPAGDDA